MAIEWSDRLSTGLDWQDEQHRSIIERIDDLLEAMRMNAGSTVVEDIMIFLSEYSDSHFRDEETYMKEHGCSSYHAHRREHEEFKEHLSGLRALYKRQGASTMVVMHLQRWLRDWLLDHIARVDREMGPFAQQAHPVQ